MAGNIGLGKPDAAVVIFHFTCSCDPAIDLTLIHCHRAEVLRKYSYFACLSDIKDCQV